jgi:hypothetical protein
MLPREPFRPGHRAPRAGGRHADLPTATGRRADTLTAPQTGAHANPVLPDSRTIDLADRRTRHSRPARRAVFADWRGTVDPHLAAEDGGHHRAAEVPRSRSARDRTDERPRRSADTRPTGERTPTRRDDERRTGGTRRAGLPRAEGELGDGGRRSGTRRRRAAASALSEPQRTLQFLMSSLGALIMAGVCGLSTFFVVADERHSHDGTTVAAAAGRDITSRTIDPAPLTVDETFPGSELNVVGATGPYRVLLTHTDSDCDLATSGEIAILLETLGCTQVVRATLAAPDSRYLATAGVFNLADEPGATRANEQVKSMLDTGRGRLTGMPAGDGTRVLDTAPAQFGWHTRGHFLTYCVLVRADGEPIEEDDPMAQRILFQMVESHLRQNVLGRRASAQV